MTETSSKPLVNSKVRWTGRIITALMTFVFGMSALMKLKGGPEFGDGAEHLGLPESMRLPLAVLELTCLAIYLIPQTSIIGAILLTGYMGGAICTHWRVGDGFGAQAIIGMLVWLGVYLREPRLWSLMPLRSLPKSPKPA